MTEVEPVLDFASSGRSGRRNALPDILGSPAGVNPGDLPLKLAEMSLEDLYQYMTQTALPQM
ncbi:cAMP-dependent protein kinase inhibitor beta isoform X2 [Hippoglossus stenolepis]|uniref:cAMP-dependent protein kinase inhibitor beta isoform X2 n=1 Tax=Hippoglossus stenolepis TaxID=195615 RepID=UPI00159BFB2B|nr:cAMP-dependent protein kinase inhibitor beta isoform X2 [Hippoglossus stenolepis]